MFTAQHNVHTLKHLDREYCQKEEFTAWNIGISFFFSPFCLFFLTPDANLSGDCITIWVPDQSPRSPTHPPPGIPLHTFLRNVLNTDQTQIKNCLILSLSQSLYPSCPIKPSFFSRKTRFSGYDAQCTHLSCPGLTGVFQSRSETTFLHKKTQFLRFFVDSN